MVLNDYLWWDNEIFEGLWVWKIGKNCFGGTNVVDLQSDKEAKAVSKTQE